MLFRSRAWGRPLGSNTTASDDDDEGPTVLAPSKSGLSTGTLFWDVGVVLALAAGPSLQAEFGTRLIEIGVTIKTVLQYNLLSGLSCVFGGEWSKGSHSVGSSVQFGFQDVTIRFECVSV